MTQLRQTMIRAMELKNLSKTLLAFDKNELKRLYRQGNGYKYEKDH